MGGEIFINDEVIFDENGLIMFEALEPTTTTTTTTEFTTTTTTTTIQPMVITKVWFDILNTYIYSTNSLLEGYFYAGDTTTKYNLGTNNNFQSINGSLNVRFYWSPKQDYDGTLKTSSITPTTLLNGYYYTQKQF